VSISAARTSSWACCRWTAATARSGAAQRADGGAARREVRRRSHRRADRGVDGRHRGAAAIEDFAGVGIGSPGPLDRATGTVINTPNLGWRNFPLRDLISNAVGLPATLDNDANCATYGEWWLGAGRNVDTLVGLTLGTGIGGGIVLNGEIFHGVSDAAGEIGHMTIEANGRKCKCGNYGCLEAYASGPAIALRAVEGIEAGAESLLPALVDGRSRTSPPRPSTRPSCSAIRTPTR
jgi:glucokinase